MKVKANFSFGDYQRNRVYEIDKDSRVATLVGAGYFTEVGDGADDSVEPVPVPDDSVDVSAPPKRKRKVADGPREDLPAGEDPNGAGSSSSAGGSDN